MIGKKIRELCEKSPYSQRELAKRLNISPPTLRRLFEMEQPDINLSLLQEISFVLNVPLSEFAEDLGVMQVVQKIDKEKNDPSGKEKDPKENELLQKIQSLETEIKRLQDALFQSQQETISILKKMLIEGSEAGKDSPYFEAALFDSRIDDLIFDLGIERAK